MESPFTKEDRKERHKSQARERYHIRKSLLERQGSRCSDCEHRAKVKLSRQKKDSEQLEESQYILLCHSCLKKRQEKQKRAYRPRSDTFKGKTPGGFWNFIRQRVFDRDGHKCVWCDSKEHLGLGPLIPLSRGGKLEIDNYVTTCEKCRPRKGRKLPLEFLFESIDIEEYLHEELDEHLRILSDDPGRFVKIRFFLFSEISEFLHRLTNDEKISSHTRTRAEQLNIKLLK
ncbi:hypothetical protein ES707_13800 [subsurface metagenome]